MSTVILRRRRLGHTSCREIANKSQQGIIPVRNDGVFPDDVDTVIRWGTTSNVPTRNVINRAEAIHRVNDKSEFRRVLDEHDLCPATWWHFRDVPADAYPVIVRPQRHAQGRHLYFCENQQMLINATQHCGPNYYISKFIPKVAEYRVFVVQGRVACVATKVPGNPDDVAWNVARGGRFDNVRWDNWPLKAVKTAIEAFHLSGLDFSGVDVMTDENGEAYILELNSAPSLTSDYRQQCMAKCFDYMLANGKDTIPLIKAKGGYRKFIHPAVCDNAILANN
ncbi:MAG: ATP-grasp domain-containing protein [candidate division Zixibacteria bacterium]|nr:ATP-grasp domain-containing protein [candidate division Zixibacteria bacterium]